MKKILIDWIVITLILGGVIGFIIGIVALEKNYAAWTCGLGLLFITFSLAFFKNN